MTKWINESDHPRAELFRLAAGIPEVRALVEAVDLLLDTLPDTCMFDDDPSWDWAWNELSGDAQSRVKFARDEAIAALAPFEEQKK